MFRFIGIAAVMIALTGCNSTMSSLGDLTGKILASEVYTSDINCTNSQGEVVSIKQGDDDFEYNGSFFEGSIYADKELFFFKGKDGEAIATAYDTNIRIIYNDGRKEYLSCGAANRFGVPANYTFTDPSYDYSTWEKVDAAIEERRAKAQAEIDALKKCKEEAPMWRMEGKCKS